MTKNYLVRRDTNVDTNHMVDTLVLRGLFVGVAGTLVFYALMSMIDDLLEEVSAGLT